MLGILSFLSGCTAQTAAESSSETVLSAGGDEITMCEQAQIGPDVFGYIDFADLQSASFDDFVSYVEATGGEVRERPSDIPTSVGVTFQKRACATSLPSDAQGYWVYRSGTKGQAFIDYEFYVSDGRIIQIDAFHNDKRPSRPVNE